MSNLIENMRNLVNDEKKMKAQAKRAELAESRAALSAYYGGSISASVNRCYKSNDVTNVVAG